MAMKQVKFDANGKAVAVDKIEKGDFVHFVMDNIDKVKETPDWGVVNAVHRRMEDIERSVLENMGDIKVMNSDEVDQPITTDLDGKPVENRQLYEQRLEDFKAGKTPFLVVDDPSQFNKSITEEETKAIQEWFEKAKEGNVRFMESRVHHEDQPVKIMNSWEYYTTPPGTSMSKESVVVHETPPMLLNPALTEWQHKEVHEAVVQHVKDHPEKMKASEVVFKGNFPGYAFEDGKVVPVYDQRDGKNELVGEAELKSDGTADFMLKKGMVPTEDWPEYPEVREDKPQHKNLLVVHDSALARDLQCKLGDEWFVLSHYHSAMGMHFKTIMIVTPRHEMSKEEALRWDQWVQILLHRKLHKNTPVVYL